MHRSSENTLDTSRGLFPWLRKKESSWSLRSLSKMTRFNSVSTVSLPLSDTASSLSSASTIQDEEMKQEAPPSYDDKSHPWTFQLPKSLLNRTILPREEEGKESLPDYECTVQRMCYVKVKCELSKPGVKSRSRSWRYYYIQIYGTKIMAFTSCPNRRKSVPVWSHSMQGAEALVATDYLKERHVIRLRIQNGPQYLITTQSEKDKTDWIIAMESAINISSDLDVRSMPQFITLLTRRRRRDLNTTTQLPPSENPADAPLL
ncbi:hypothetical protein INT47_008692 [Mucor saturninus]|uniref:PH domain-containing protein n=1 Tax=Mucor saturninus TaxID=64648 RepID=A0A8H7V659_9FUNG|nr:hypothetical protein INT47_008692 [Mucor saturninus]